MSHKLQLIGALIAMSSSLSCVMLGGAKGVNYDLRPLTIQTLGLFSQREASRITEKSWRGDWVYRRERLALIDVELRRVKPDIVLFQDLMQRRQTASESDLFILNAGSLANYLWHMQLVDEFNDTNEQNFMGIAVSMPLKIQREEKLQPLFYLNKSSYVTYAVVNADGGPLVVFNVVLRGEAWDKSRELTELQNFINSKMTEFAICHNRLVIGGDFENVADDVMARFKDALKIGDVADQFCALERNCHTATSRNELYMATKGDIAPQREDRIMVPESAIVYAGGINFKTPEPFTYPSPYGFELLWPTQRFGWYTTARFLGCEAMGSL